MCAFVKGLCVLSFLQANFYSIQGLSYDEDVHVSRQFTIQQNNGIFVRFLMNSMDLLLKTFSERKLIRYCRILSRELDKMEFEYTRQLAKILRRLSRTYRDNIKEEITLYRDALDTQSRLRSEFLKAMDQVFTQKESMQFNDYVHDLKDYGNEDKLFIHEETGKNLNDVIVGSIFKLSARDQTDLRKKMKKAIREFKAESK